MPTVAAPKHDISHPDAAIDCEFALEPAFQELLREAVRVGWDEGLVSRSLIGLASSNLRGMQADHRTNMDIEALARSTP